MGVRTSSSRRRLDGKAGNGSKATRLGISARLERGEEVKARILATSDRHLSHSSCSTSEKVKSILELIVVVYRSIVCIEQVSVAMVMRCAPT